MPRRDQLLCTIDDDQLRADCRVWVRVLEELDEMVAEGDSLRRKKAFPPLSKRARAALFRCANHKSTVVGSTAYIAARQALIRALDSVRSKRHMADTMHYVYFVPECLKITIQRAKAKGPTLDARSKRTIRNQLMQMNNEYLRTLAAIQRQLARDDHR